MYYGDRLIRMNYSITKYSNSIKPTTCFIIYNTLIFCSLYSGVKVYGMIISNIFFVKFINNIFKYCP